MRARREARSRDACSRAAAVRVAVQHIHHAGRELELAGYEGAAEDVRRLWGRLRRLEGATTHRAHAIVARIVRHLRRAGR